MSDGSFPSPDIPAEPGDAPTIADAQLPSSAVPVAPVPPALWIPVMTVGVVGAAAVFWSHRSNLFWAVCLTALVVVSAHLAAVDFHQQRLPNKIVGPLAAVTTAAILAFGLIESDLSRSLRALGLGLAAFFVLLLMNLAGGMGMGDVKFGFPLGAALGWFGLDALIVAAMVMVLSGGVVAVGVLIKTRSKNSFFAFGPFMAIGLVVALVLAGDF